MSLHPGSQSPWYMVHQQPILSDLMQYLRVQ